jgi:hypothetical protein
MTDWEFFLLASFTPVATVIMAFVIMYLTRDKPEPPQPGE